MAINGIYQWNSHTDIRFFIHMSPDQPYAHMTAFKRAQIALQTGLSSLTFKFPQIHTLCVFIRQHSFYSWFCPAPQTSR